MNVEPKSHRLLFVCVFKKRDRSRSEELTGGETGRGNVHARGDQRGQFDERRLCTDAWTEVLTRLRFPPPAGLVSDTDARHQVRQHHPGSDGREAGGLRPRAHSERGDVRTSKWQLAHSLFQPLSERRRRKCMFFLFVCLFIYLFKIILLLVPQWDK